MKKKAPKQEKRVKAAQILKLMSQKGIVSVYDLIAAFNLTYPAAAYHLWSLKQKRLVKRVGWGQYRLSKFGERKAWR